MARPSSCWKESSSRRATTRSIAVFLPRLCCLSTASCRRLRAWARRSARSAALPAVVRRSGLFSSTVAALIAPPRPLVAYLSGVSDDVVVPVDADQVERRLADREVPWPRPMVTAVDGLDQRRPPRVSPVAALPRGPSSSRRSRPPAAGDWAAHGSVRPGRACGSRCSCAWPPIRSEASCPCSPASPWSRRLAGTASSRPSSGPTTWSSTVPHSTAAPARASWPGSWPRPTARTRS